MPPDHCSGGKTYSVGTFRVVNILLYSRLFIDIKQKNLSVLNIGSPVSERWSWKILLYIQMRKSWFFLGLNAAKITKYNKILFK